MVNNLVRMVEQLPVNGVYILPKKPLMPVLQKRTKGILPQTWQIYKLISKKRFIMANIFIQ